MPRARQLPRTRALLVLRRLVWFVALVLLTIGGIAIPAAGGDWWIALLVFAGVMTLVIWVAGLVVKQIDKRIPSALTKDQLALPLRDRLLPYGVVEDDGAMLLPTKLGIVVLSYAFTLALLAAAVAAIVEGDPAGRVVGIVMALFGLWMVLICYWITGCRIRLTTDGVESRMGPRRFYEWLEVPELKVDRAIVILKAAGAKRPRVWIRAGLLEVSVADCVAMIRRQRGW